MTQAVVVALEGAFLAVVDAADGGVVALFAVHVVPIGGVAIGDVLSLLEVHTVVIRAVVHVGSQLVQVVGTGNQVRVGTGAATTPCPRRGRREQHHEQQHGCPHREMS